MQKLSLSCYAIDSPKIKAINDTRMTFQLIVINWLAKFLEWNPHTHDLVKISKKMNGKLKQKKLVRFTNLASSKQKVFKSSKY